MYKPTKSFSRNRTKTSHFPEVALFFTCFSSTSLPPGKWCECLLRHQAAMTCVCLGPGPRPGTLWPPSYPSGLHTALAIECQGLRATTTQSSGALQSPLCCERHAWRGTRGPCCCHWTQLWLNYAPPSPPCPSRGIEPAPSQACFH